MASFDLLMKIWSKAACCAIFKENMIQTLLEGEMPDFDAFDHVLEFCCLINSIIILAKKSMYLIKVFS